VSNKDRLRRLEGGHEGAESKEDAQLRLQEIRSRAEGANDRRSAKGEAPPFTILSGGETFCSHDGRPITDPHQISTEQLYWREVGLGGKGLVHDEENQAFYTPEGELALSRDFVHLERLMGEERMKAWESESA
jgi:hypothetical protein